MQHLFFLLLIASLLQMTQNTEDINLYPYWKAGDSQTIKIQEGYIKTKGNEIIAKEVTTSTVDIKITGETDSTYVIEWTYRDVKEERINIELEEGEEEEEFLDKRLNEIFSEVTLRFETNEYGEIKSMLNLDQIVAAMSDSMNLFIEQEMDLEDGDGAEEDAAIFTELVNILFDSESLKEEMAKDIYNYHYYLGSSLTPDTTVHYLDTIVNNFGGADIPQTGVVTIKTNRSTETIDIIDLKSSDESHIKKSIEETARVLGASKTDEIKTGLQNIALTITDIENYTYDYNLGWLKFYKRKRIREIGESRKVQFITIEEVNTK